MSIVTEPIDRPQAYGQQRTAELGIEPGDVPARVQEFLKSSAGHSGQ